MKKIIPFLVFALGPAGLSAANDNLLADLSACVAIQENDERLDCFDKIAALSVKEEEDKSDTVDTGDWVVYSRIDPMTDDAVHFAALEAESGRGRYGDPISLIVRCANNKTEMYIAWNSYLGRDSIGVTYRAGDEKAITNNWTISTDNQATFFNGSPISFLKKMTESAKFTARLTPYSESPVTAIFDTTGAANAFKDIRETCGW